MTVRVKICGLTRPEDIAAAVESGADFLGFIVEAPSKRRLSVEAAATLAAPARGITARVAVTVDADDALLRNICAVMVPDYIQCHGAETPKRLAQISRQFGVKTIKAVSIKSGNDMIPAERYVGACDFILYDAAPPKGSIVRGGHGMQIDWALFKRAPLPKTFALAGGLNARNVARAIEQTGAPIVDVSSGVERAAGIKDSQKIHAFMNAARRASRNG
jgi:phosphoribosylanthranilate isomerase